MESTKKTKQNKNKHIDTENKLMVARYEEVGGLGEKGKGLRITNWQLKNSHGHVQYSPGNIVKNMVITMYDVRRVFNLLGDHFVHYINV